MIKVTQEYGFETPNSQDGNNSTTESMTAFIQSIRGLIDTCIKSRIDADDIMVCYNAEVTSVSNSTETVYGTYKTASESTVTVSIDIPTTVSVSVKLNGAIYNNVKNCTGETLNVGDWVKLVTYDKVTYYALHKTFAKKKQNEEEEQEEQDINKS